jgi:hypothetical protein
LADSVPEGEEGVSCCANTGRPANTNKAIARTRVPISNPNLIGSGDASPGCKDVKIRWELQEAENFQTRL